MAAYITPDVAFVYLAEHDIDHFPTTGALEVASDALDGYGTFRGGRYGGTAQARAFPRTEVLAGDTAGVVPTRVERWVALEAYKLDTDDDPSITSISSDAGSVTYGESKPSLATRLQESLLFPYLVRKPGVITSALTIRG